MNIGIITYYRVPNFGANLQALSTYYYLKGHGYNPIMIHYLPTRLYEFANTFNGPNDQKKAHIDFVDSYFKNQSRLCVSAEEVNQVVVEENIKGLIIGSDALVQHHPLLERIHYANNCRRHFRIDYMPPEQMFPNVFWGVDLAPEIKKVMMSVSSQNSRYKYFSPNIMRRMRNSLSHFSYISARDEWTKLMFKRILRNDVLVTPDPVFAFNQNCGIIIQTREDLLSKYHLPQKYVLVCLRAQTLTMDTLANIKEGFELHGINCVALPMPTGIMFDHPFNYEISSPLPTDDWYGLIKYSSGYIGSNMHPIIVSLHNSVPCFSLDDWINYDFWNRPLNDASSKVEHIMNVFGVQANRRIISNNLCNVTSDEIIKGILCFPVDHVRTIANKMYDSYLTMMQEICEIFSR